ncbi:hypothetical protein DICVIV_08793 [Dictyocaulus viviparus]|uniref:Uncharacterized protein n=1 Tax=Dictyocaulus viviparus TaxID=29172 RepID=A0A0D8XN28_DICVI|nr:hypothetical protein DICVIV_08793 [Dictyocaulus viviparus]
MEQSISLVIIPHDERVVLKSTWAAAIPVRSRFAHRSCVPLQRVSFYGRFDSNVIVVISGADLQYVRAVVALSNVRDTNEMFENDFYFTD